MTYDIKGKHVLITGASSGIGAALAEGFAERGAVVGICARRADRLAEVLERVRKHSPESQMWQVDLADLAGLEAFAGKVSRELGGVDVLVNNAGIPKRKTVQVLTPEIVESVMAINYFSPVRLTLALLPELIERGGRIINLSSVAARLGPPAEAAYTASKAAITGWSESMLIDLADTDVKVHVVNPGVIDTELFQLPDNDAMVAEVEALPVRAIVDPVLAQLESGVFEIYVPEWFANVVGGKFPDTTKYFQGTIDWMRSQRDAS
jgi:NAD(P)-dependent dehydrogenase (short-subunit alcohol dehydrogenase family)